MTFLRATVSSLAFAGIMAWAPTAVAQARPAAPQAASEFDASDPEQTAYVDGNLIFLTYHEIGHLLLDIGLDVDQEVERRASEEVADDIATWLMLPDPDEPQRDEEILAAIAGWARSAQSQDGVAASPHYPNDGERAARIACYLYGSNPNLYRPLETLFSEALESVNCQEEFEVLETDLVTWFASGLVTADKPGTPPSVRYEPAPASLSAARAYLIESEILDGAAADIAQFVRVPADTAFVAMSCGRGAAEFRYSPGARMITACYEAVDWLMRDANDEEQDVATQGDAAASSGGLGSGGARVTQRPRPPRVRR